MVGAGFMGRGLANQIVNSVPGMELVAIANRDLGQRRAGLPRGGGRRRRRVVDDAAAVDRAVAAAGRRSPRTTAPSPTPDSVDAIVEVTGAVEYGCHVSVRAIEHGKHVVLMNAEVDATVGPLLRRDGRRGRRRLTGCDGDQPGVQMNLVRFVRGIGLTPLVAATSRACRTRTATRPRRRASPSGGARTRTW